LAATFRRLKESRGRGISSLLPRDPRIESSLADKADRTGIDQLEMDKLNVDEFNKLADVVRQLKAR
jgi:hypothetical protein